MPVGSVDPGFNGADDAADIPEGFNIEGWGLRFFMFIRICSTSLKMCFPDGIEDEFLPALRDLLIVLSIFPPLNRFRPVLAHVVPG